MKKTKLVRSALCGALLALVATPGIAASGGDGWTWTAAPYIWATSIKARPNFTIDADLDTTIFELAAVWSPGATRYQGFEAIVGMRYMDVELGLAADPVNPALSGRSTGFDKGYTDVLIGARYTVPLADKWALGFRGDASFGDSEGSWSANVMFRRELGSGALLLGYRYFDVELEPGADSFDLTLYGPEIGYAFVW